MLSLGGERLPLPPPPPKKKKDNYLHHDRGMPLLLWCFFAHFLIWEYLDNHQNLISSSVYYPGPLHKISSQSIHNFLSNVVHRQTDKQTDRQTNAAKNITSFAKEVIIAQECTWWGEGIDSKTFCFIALHLTELLLKLAFWNLACSVYTQILFLPWFLFFLTLKLLIWYRLPFYFYFLHLHLMGEVKVLIQNFLFHCVLGQVKVLIQNFLFHRVLGEVKICINPELFVSSLYISVAIKASVLKFNMFNIHKNNISNIFFSFFSNFEIVDLM